jgi:hypothetical protein
MLVRSDELLRAGIGLFLGINVVLCTLSTLSNPTLAGCGLFRHIPMRSLVIDEASQIDVYHFMVIFSPLSMDHYNLLHPAPVL